jgi:hypothetical protein
MLRHNSSKKSVANGSFTAHRHSGQPIDGKDSRQSSSSIRRMAMDAKWIRMWFKDNDPENCAIIIDKVIAVTGVIEDGLQHASFKIVLLDGEDYKMRYSSFQKAVVDRQGLLSMLEGIR